MSWTDSDTVKKHLLGLSVEGLNIREHKVILGDEEIQLPHRNLVDDSVRVAAHLEKVPSGPIQITLNGTTWYSIAYSNLLLNSVTVTPNNMPTDRYIEGADYLVNHEDGEIKRIEGGDIISGSTVYVWSLPLTVYQYHNDYSLDYPEGRLDRSIGSSIPNPALLLVDYITIEGGVTNTLISQAIIEAEDKIASRLREGYTTESTDQGLITGATELTLSILCDDLGIQAISTARDHGADDRARRFMELSKRYQERAANTLSRFLTQPLMSEARPKSNPSSPPGW